MPARTTVAGTGERALADLTDRLARGLGEVAGQHLDDAASTMPMTTAPSAIQPRVAVELADGLVGGRRRARRTCSGRYCEGRDGDQHGRDDGRDEEAAVDGAHAAAVARCAGAVA